MAMWLGHSLEVQNGFYVDPQNDNGAVKAYNKLQECRKSAAKDNKVIENIWPPNKSKYCSKLVYHLKL